MAYDIIGDIHGQAFKLESLLDKLGYWNTSGAWRHPGRTAVFGGNLIDRGPHQFRSIELVRRVIEDGAARAVLGKHEFNAIARHTPHPSGNGEFLLPHFHPGSGSRNRRQYEWFLAEVKHNPLRHREIIT